MSEIIPIEITQFIPEQEDYFWRDISLDTEEGLKQIHILFIQSIVFDRISVGMIFELSEYISKSSSISDEYIELFEYASTHGKVARQKYLSGVLAYNLRNLSEDPSLRVRCVLALGLASAELGINKQSLPLLFQAKQGFATLGSQDAVTYCNRYLAQELSEVGRTDESMQLLQENLAYYESTEELLELAHTNFTLGNLYYHITDYNSALNSFTKAKDAYISAANSTKWFHMYIELSINAAICNLSMASVYDDMGMHEQALQLCEIAREIYSRKGYDFYDKTGMAKCNRTMATIYSRLNQPQKALELYLQARAVFQKEGFEIEVAQCTMNMAGIYDDDLDDQETSLSLFQESRAIYEKHGFSHMVRKVDLDIAIVKRNIERKKDQSDSLPVAFRFNAEGLNNIPVVVTRSSELEVGMLGKYAELVEQGASPKDRALYLLYNTDPTNPVNVENLIKLCDPLIPELEQEPRILWKVYYHLAQAYRHKASLFHYYNSNPLLPIALEMQGLNLMTFVQSLSERKQNAFHRFLSERHFNLENYVEAIIDEEFLDSVGDDVNKEDSFKSEGDAGESFIFPLFLIYKEEKYKNLEKAYEHICSAIQVLNELRGRQISDDAKIDFMKAKHHVFRLAIDLCIDLEEYESALAQIEQSKSRSLVEMLAKTNIRVPDTLPRELVEREKELLAYLRGNIKEVRNIKQLEELSDRTEEFNSSARVDIDKRQFSRTYKPAFNTVLSELEEIYAQFIKVEPEYVALRRVESFGSQDIQKVLKAQKKKTAIIGFYIGNVLLGLSEQQGEKLDYRLVTGERLLVTVWGNQNNKPALFQIPLTIEGLRDLVEEAVYEIRQRAASIALSELARIIFSPVEEYISNYELLLITPYGPLHNIPFHALPFREKVLIDYFDVAITPSISVLNHCQNRDHVTTNDYLVLGYSDASSDSRNSIEEEAKAVAKLFETKAYVGEKATKQVFINNCKGTNITHLACHGEFSKSNPMDSAIYLSGGCLLKASEIFSLDTRSNLITLSACESGLNEVITGDELIGLTRSLLYAGARSVVVSLWRVESASTKEFMSCFYELLVRGEDKSSAIRKAQIKIREKYPYPFYWSPFILVGDWQ